MKIDPKNSIFLIFAFAVISVSVTLVALAVPKTIGFTPEYILFTAVFVIYILFTASRIDSFVRLFLCLFLTLGFYIKLNYHLLTTVTTLIEPTGYFDFSPEQYANALLIISIAILAIIFSDLALRNKLLFSFRQKNVLKFNERKVLLAQFVIFAGITFVCFLNFYYKIYQKGNVAIPFFSVINSFFAWGLLFGFSALMCSFVMYFKSFKYKISSIVLLILVMNVTSLSLLSSTFVISILIIPFVILFFDTNFLKLRSGIALSVFVVVLFGFSINIVTKLRYQHLSLVDTTTSVQTQDRAPTASSLNQKVKTPNVLNTIAVLSIGRWVGLEGVFAAVSFNGQRDKTFHEILNENPRLDDVTSVYDKKVALSIYSKEASVKSVYKLTTPGFIGWISILNNKIFVFSAVFLFYTLLFLTEFLCFKVSNSFYITAIIGQALAYRFCHFGYMPVNSYKLLAGIILSLCAFLLIDRFLIRFATEKT